MMLSYLGRNVVFLALISCLGQYSPFGGYGYGVSGTTCLNCKTSTPEFCSNTCIGISCSLKYNFLDDQTVEVTSGCTDDISLQNGCIENRFGNETLCVCNTDSCNSISSSIHPVDISLKARRKRDMIEDYIQSFKCFFALDGCKPSNSTTQIIASNVTSGNVTATKSLTVVQNGTTTMPPTSANVNVTTTILKSNTTSNSTPMTLTTIKLNVTSAPLSVQSTTVMMTNMTTTMKPVVTTMVVGVTTIPVSTALVSQTNTTSSTITSATSASSLNSTSTQAIKTTIAPTLNAISASALNVTSAPSVNATSPSNLKTTLVSSLNVTTMAPSLNATVIPKTATNTTMLMSSTVMPTTIKPSNMTTLMPTTIIPTNGTAVTNKKIVAPARALEIFNQMFEIGEPKFFGNGKNQSDTLHNMQVEFQAQQNRTKALLAQVNVIKNA